MSSCYNILLYFDEPLLLQRVSLLQTSYRHLSLKPGRKMLNNTFITLFYRPLWSLYSRETVSPRKDIGTKLKHSKPFLFHLSQFNTSGDKYLTLVFATNFQPEPPCIRLWDSAMLFSQQYRGKCWGLQKVI